MNIDLSDDQRALNEQLDVFLRDATTNRLHKAFDGDIDTARSMWHGMLQMGLGGVLISEEYGGLDLGILGASSISERVGFAAMPGPWISHVLAGYAIQQAGSQEQRRRWLPLLATGEMSATVALMEDAEWRPQAWQMKAASKLSGTKDYVMGLDEAEIAVVGLADGRLGIIDCSATGLVKKKWASTDRTRPVGRLTMDEVAVDLMPGRFTEPLLSAALVLAAADSHGGCLRVRDDIIEYSNTRIQFDRPISAFQAVKHKLVDLALHMQFNGPLYRIAAATCDEHPETAALAASNANAHITEIFASSARIATEAYGGIGYTWEHTAHIWLRRSMFNFAWLGQPGAHRKRVADLLGW